jgi:TRAP-type C4-dicarboxylate transport system substrate-binding protein
MNKKAFARNLSLLLVCSMLFAFLAACGGSSTDTSSGSASSGTSTPAASSSTPASGDTAPADDKVYELSFSTHDPSTSYKTQFHEEWAKRINEESNGRINITVYPGGSLVASTDALDAVRTGQCDSAWVYSSYFPGQFPLCEVLTLPLGFSSVPQAANVLWDLYDAYPQVQAEFKDFQVIMLHSNPVNVLCTDKDHPVDSVSDLKGLVIRCPSGVPTELLTAWGANPIVMGPGDIFEAIQKGVIQGAVFDYSGVRAFSLQEVVKNFTQITVYLGPYFLLMNKDSFNNLPEDLQQVVLDNSGRDISVEMGYVFEGDEKISRDQFKEAGCQFIDVSDADKADFYSYGQDLIDNWVSSNTSADFDAAAYAEKAKELAAQYEISRDDLNTKLEELGW